MAAIFKLPNELFEQILSYLDHKDLHKVSLSSRKLNEVSLPYLYADFQQTGEDGQALPALIRTLLERPDLAPLIKRYTGTSVVKQVDLSLLDTQQLQSIKENWLPNDDRADIWYDMLCSNDHYSWDAVTAMLLLFLSNGLESITLSYAREDGKPGYDHDVASHFFIDRVLYKMARLQDQSISLDSMSKLRSVTILYDDCIGYGSGFGEVLPFLALKSVQCFVAKLIDSQERVWYSDEDYEGFNDDLEKVNMQAFGAKKVILKAGSLSVEDLSKFLALFSSIASFECTPTQKGDGGYSDTSPSIAEALIPHQKSLQSLVVNHNSSSLHRETEGGIIGSLSGFDKLTSLDVCAGSLMGSFEAESAFNEVLYRRLKYGAEKTSTFREGMPDCLEHLIIRKCTTAIFDCMSEYFPAGSPPRNLKTVDLHFEQGSPTEPHDRNGNWWEEAASKVGVVLTRHEHPDGGGTWPSPRPKF